MHRYQKLTNPSTSTKQFPFLATATNLIQALCRQKTRQSIKSTFDKLYRNSLNILKKSSRFAKTLNKLTTLKQINYKKFVFGVLYQLKISEILANRQKVALLKQKSRNSASSLIGNILAKNMKSQISEVFIQLKNKSLLIKQRSTFKTLNLTNSIKALENKLLRKGLKLIKVQSFTLLARYKRCFLIEKFYAKKRIENITWALDALKGRSQKIQQKQTNPVLVQDAEPNQADILKELEEQKRLLQTQLNQLKAANRTSVKTKQQQLQKMQSEHESLRFNFDVMTQENSELAESINQRERLASEAQSRKKRQEQAMLTRRSVPQRVTRFNQNDMWKHVFDNLMCYLYKLKAGYDKSAFSLEKLLQKMTEPLISLSVYTQKAQLQEENSVLRDLLDSYKAAFNKKPSEELNEKQIPYTLEILNKQRRYLYLALDCLTRWGTTEAQGLEEIKFLLEKIKDQGDRIVSVANGNQLIER